MPDIILASKTYDPAGYLELDLDSDREGIAARERRTTVTPTLDGGVVAEDVGMSHGDRRWTLKARLSATEAVTLKHLHDAYAQLNITTKEGIFTCAPQRLSFAGSLAQLQLLVISKDA